MADNRAYPSVGNSKNLSKRTVAITSRSVELSHLDNVPVSELRSRYSLAKSVSFLGYTISDIGQLVA